MSNVYGIHISLHLHISATGQNRHLTTLDKKENTSLHDIEIF